MNNFQPVKVATIGCGKISDAYLATMISNFKILDVVACCDHHPDRAEETARKYDLKVMTGDEIMADPSIELVVNLTQPTAHYTVIKQMLQAGKHVYTEKVLTLELAEAAELVGIANRKNLYLGVAPDTFLGSAIQTARYVVESGMIGEVTSCCSVLNRDGYFLVEKYPFCAKPGGGIGLDVGIYYLTALLSILGPVGEVSGVSKTRDKTRRHIRIESLGEPYEMMCETLLAGTLQFKNGVVGSLLFDSSSIRMSPEKPTFTLFGTMGIIQMADPNQFGGDVRVILKGNTEPFIMQQSHPYSDQSRGLGVAEMAWSLRKGRKNRANKEMAYHALEVLLGIVKSGGSGQNYIVESTFEKMPPLPRGYLGESYLSGDAEAAIAL